MKHLPALLLALGILFATSAASQTATQSEIQFLDQLEQDKAVYNRSLITELGRFKQFDSMPMLAGLLKMKERAGWLTERVRKPDSDYRLGYALAVYQWKMGDSKDASLTLARADLRAFVDGQRCEDKTSSPGRTAPWRNAAQPIYAVIRNSSPELKAEVRKAIEQEEGQVSARVPSPWMCSGGAMHITKLMAKYPEIGAHDPKTPMPQSLIDKYPTVISVSNGRVELTDYSIQPDFISEDVWNKDLPRMIEAFKKSYFPTLGIN